MVYSTPISDLIQGHHNYYNSIGSDESRFVFTGICTKEVNSIIDMCETLFGYHYDYLFFTEEEVFGPNNQYPYGCYYFFPYGTRDKKVKITKEEVEGLYWY